MKSALCPLCRQPSQADFRPFCSRGCKDRDLIKWLDGGYVVAPRIDDDEEDTSGLDRDS